MYTVRALAFVSQLRIHRQSIVHRV
jgi:hypothetical protein